MPGLVVSASAKHNHQTSCLTLIFIIVQIQAPFCPPYFPLDPLVLLLLGVEVLASASTRRQAHMPPGIDATSVRLHLLHLSRTPTETKWSSKPPTPQGSSSAASPCRPSACGSSQACACSREAECHIKETITHVSYKCCNI